MKKNKLYPLVTSGAITLSLVATVALAEPVAGGTLYPETIPQFTQALIIPPEMPASKITYDKKTNVIKHKYYDIGVRQFEQQILPLGYPVTKVWSYGPADSPWVTTGQPDGFNYPAYTIEAEKDVPTQVNWQNQLTDGSKGPFLPHLLTEAVDQTLHWANPAMDECAHPLPTDTKRKPDLNRTDCKGTTDVPYYGPIPMSPHVHGAHVGPESDGYPESWWLPNANNIPKGYATRGNKWLQIPGKVAKSGRAVFEYPNSQRAATLWYHDHSLGMTRQNVYAGPAGFYLVRDTTESSMNLPLPAPRTGDGLKYGDYREIPIVIQDRSFNADGSLFYPTDRAFFEGLPSDGLDLPFDGQAAVEAGEFSSNDNGDQIGFLSDIAPIWNPEAFFNTNVVNGRVWPFLNVEPQPYRFRILNGANSRFYNLSLKVVNSDGTLGAEIPFYQIGSDGGLLLNPVKVTKGYKTVVGNATQTAAGDEDEALLMGPAERMDVIVDFSDLPPGTKKIRMVNTAPDAPFGGFGDDPADPETTGRVMEFHVGVADPSFTDDSNAITAWIAPQELITELDVPALTPGIPPRQVSLNEEESSTLCVDTDPDDGSWAIVNDVVTNWMPCNFVTTISENYVPFAPKAALIGTQDAALGEMGVPTALTWMDTMTELPTLGDTEMWEVFNNTVDAHPIHQHLVQYRVVNREDPATGNVVPVGDTESGWKDTVIAYPGQITRFIATYDRAGLYVFHCHILEHEDNEMMRPFCVLDPTNPDCNGVDGITAQ